MSGQTDIKSLTPEELADFLRGFGQPAFRARQVFAWLHRGVESFDEMTDLPLSLRQSLAENASLSVPRVERRLESKLDGTVKYLYGLRDGEAIETVLMRYHYGDSVCISTEAGCPMGCSFCASPLAGFRRGLTPAEMLDQVLFTQKDTGRRVSHCVLMGIGEPLDNYDNVVKFLHILSCPGGLNLSLRHVSLSTCGLVDRIYDLMKLKLQLTLSVSLHAPNDRLRSRLMPVNRRWGVGPLLEACRAYTEATGRRISFEYAMIEGVNDTPACARELGSRLRGMLCHVNLIPVNSVKEKDYRKSPEPRMAQFAKVLAGYGLNVTVRRTLGSDINASCGQLRRAHGGSGEGTTVEYSGEN